MPEIWLKYGLTDIALDIKFGNLLAEVSSELTATSEEEIAATLEDMPMSNNMLIFALSRSNQRMLRYVIQSRRFGGVDIALPKIIDRFRA